MFVQKFLIPTLNFEGSHYSDITVDLFHEPIFTSKIASEEIVSYCRRKFKVKKLSNPYPISQKNCKIGD